MNWENKKNNLKEVRNNFSIPEPAELLIAPTKSYL
jgi:hypothetical protein